MSDYGEFLLTFIRQFAGGPGAPENNLVRFGLAAILWGALLVIAWNRQKSEYRPRERLLVWGFALALSRELIMFTLVALKMLSVQLVEQQSWIYQPIEHGLAMAALIVIAAAFLRYALNDARHSGRYLRIGLAVSFICTLIVLLPWSRGFFITPEVQFHRSWGAWLFHIPLVLFILLAIFMLARERDWLRNVVIAALSMFLLSEIVMLVNNATAGMHASVYCPISNSLHILAIPILGFVYLREQSLEKKKAEGALAAYRQHLEELVDERTADLLAVNEQLTLEISERRQAEVALERLSRRNQQILESAGEGICGINHLGQCTFVNPAAANMLGYKVEELVGLPSHQSWHHSTADASPYPEEKCPICDGYRHGIASAGDDQIFWRKDGSSFPVRYASSPTYENGELAGTVVVFQDVTERKRNEAEIARRNASLAAQNAVADTLSQSLELHTILTSSLETVLAVLAMDVGIVFMGKGGAEDLEVETFSGDFTECDLFESVINDCFCCEISTLAVTSQHGIVVSRTDIPPEKMSCFLENRNIQFLVSVPLMSKGHAKGALTLGSKRDNAIEQSELELLTSIGQQIGMAIENARLYQDAERWAAELTQLNQACTNLASTLDSASITEEIAVQASRLLNCEMTCVLSWDESKQIIEIISSRGLSDREKHCLETSKELSHFLQEVMIQGTAYASDSEKTGTSPPLPRINQFPLQSLLCIPVWGPETPEAFLLLLEQHAPRRWRPDELELINSFVSSAAVALQNAKLHQQLEWAAALEERQRIAANMHDGLAQTLSLLGLRVDQVSGSIMSGTKEQALQDLHLVRDAVEEASSDVRRSIASLHELPRERHSLQELLSDMVSERARNGAVSIHLIDHLPEPLLLSPVEEAHVLPVVQEATLNALRHSGAQHLTILVEDQGDHICISVKDDGRGFDSTKWRTASKGHFGLSIMRARAAEMGAELHIASDLGCGTEIRLAWPTVAKSLHTKVSIVPPATPKSRTPLSSPG